MPHEAVRDMIENYGNEQLAHSYMITALNKRGVYTVTSGEAERKIAGILQINLEYVGQKQLEYMMLLPECMKLRQFRNGRMQRIIID